MRTATMLEKSAVTVVVKGRIRTLCANLAKFTRFPFCFRSYSMK